MPRTPFARLLVLPCLLCLLAACTGHAVLAPASAPPPSEKPALASPPGSLMTPAGY